MFLSNGQCAIIFLDDLPKLFMTMFCLVLLERATERSSGALKPIAKSFFALIKGGVMGLSCSLCFVAYVAGLC